MKEDHLIHIKLEYDELLKTKRDILSLQMCLLKILKTIKKFHILRVEELRRKQLLQRKLRDTNTKIRNLHTALPKAHFPEILQDKKIREKAKQEVKEIKYASEEDQGLESQLQEIQGRLKELSQ